MFQNRFSKYTKHFIQLCYYLCIMMIKTFLLKHPVCGYCGYLHEYINDVFVRITTQWKKKQESICAQEYYLHAIFISSIFYYLPGNLYIMGVGWLVFIGQKVKRPEDSNMPHGLVVKKSFYYWLAAKPLEASRYT